MSLARAPLNLEQQAELIFDLLQRCKMTGGKDAAETWMRVSADTLQDLRHIETRLRRMAPHEAAIKRVVMTK